MDLDQYPVIELPGSEGWRASYEMGGILEQFFPNQEASDLCYAIEYNDAGPLVDGVFIAGLICTVVGERDDGNWTWLVTTSTGEHWVAEGGCDYTGWDCRSWLGWEKFDVLLEQLRELKRDL